MNTHLDENELTTVAAGGTLSADRQAHLETCLKCRREVDRFLEAVEARKRALDLEEPDWNDQMDRVLGAIAEQEAPVVGIRRRWVRPLLAAAATVMLMVGTGVVVHRTGVGPQPTPVPDLRIDEILAETDSLLADDGIPGLEILDDVSDDDLDALFGNRNS